MKKTLAAMLAIAGFASSVFAADTIQMKRGVKFNHLGHQTSLGDCKKCHAKGLGKIEGFGKAFAHDEKNKKGCNGCHKDMKKGPKYNECKKCHPQA